MNSNKIHKIHLYNTLTRKKENFSSINKGKVLLYSCGPTVYNYPHIGNYRAYIFADILKRVLMYEGYKVKHIMNLTDIDDKTIRDSQKEGKTLKKFTEFYTEEFLKDIKSLNIKNHYAMRDGLILKVALLRQRLRRALNEFA